MLTAFQIFSHLIHFMIFPLWMKDIKKNKSYMGTIVTHEHFQCHSLSTFWVSSLFTCELSARGRKVN
jgi:hypothetical protein